MTVRIHILVLLACIVFLVLRAFLQPANFDFDERAHVITVRDILTLGGLPGAEAFPGIAHAGPGQPYAYHYSPPLPYLALAGLATLSAVDREGAQLRTAMRIVSVAMASLTLIIVGLSIRRLAPQSDGWTASTFATAGLVLMPGFHSAAASGSPESLMFLAIASLTGAVIHAMRRKWSLTATLLVGASAALLVSTRQVGYPTLILVPMALLGSRLGLRNTMVRLGMIASVTIGVNCWWMIRSYLLFGDPVGAAAHVEATRASGHSLSTRENELWTRSSSALFPEFTLLSSTPWFWVQESRMLLRTIWIAPVALAGWIAAVILPTLYLTIRWARLDTHSRWSQGWLLAGALLAPAAAFAIQVSISARYGAFVSGRYEFANLIPLVIVVSGLLSSSDIRSWRYVRSAGLMFAGALTAAYLAVILP